MIAKRIDVEDPALNSIRSSIRRARPEDAERLVELFQIAYGVTSHPEMDVNGVRERLRDGRNIWLVGEDADGIVAVMGMIYYPWNDAYELGRAFTLPAYRKTGIAQELIRQICRWVQSENLGDLIFGFPRVRRIYDICANSVDPAIIPTGHDGGVNLANNQREYHLIICTPKRGARFTHVTPRSREITRSEFVQERIYRPLGLEAAPGEYPETCFVGPQSQHTGSGNGSPFLYDYDPESCSGTLEINGCLSDSSEPRGIRRKLEELLSVFPAVKCISATILADKEELIYDLREMGFEITAYLPAWYKSGQKRYDCLKIVRRNSDEVPVANGMEDIIQSFQQAYSSLFAGIRSRACLAN